MAIHPDPYGEHRRLLKRRAKRRAPAIGRFLTRAVFAVLFVTIAPVLALRFVDPPTSSFMLRARLMALMDGREGYQTRYRWRDWDAISPHAAVAVVAAEDQLFPQHYGFDLLAIEKAWDGNQRGRRVRGASTISQQVAKNLFLWPGKSLLRKGIEAYFTLLIEALWPKRRILEVYLNIAQFGDGIYGVDVAAERFFDKSPARLSAREAASLAAVLPNPVALRVDRPTPYVLNRRDWILNQMARLGGPGYLDHL